MIDMVRDVQLFGNNEFGEIRAYNDEGNEEAWFIARDIAEALGYTNPLKAIRDHVEEEDKRHERIIHPNGGGAQLTLVINQFGVSSLVLGSKKPAAKKFKRWIITEVLPAIQKTGIYASPVFNANPLTAFKKILEIMENNELRMNTLEASIKNHDAEIIEIKAKLHNNNKKTIPKGYKVFDRTKIPANYKSLKELAEQFNLYSVNGYPHIKLMAAIVRNTDINYNIRHVYEDDDLLSVVYIRENGCKSVIQFFKPNGIKKIKEYIESNILYKELCYIVNRGHRNPGDFRKAIILVAGKVFAVKRIENLTMNNEYTLAEA